MKATFFIFVFLLSASHLLSLRRNRRNYNGAQFPIKNEYQKGRQQFRPKQYSIQKVINQSKKQGSGNKDIRRKKGTDQKRPKNRRGTMCTLFHTFFTTKTSLFSNKSKTYESKKVSNEEPIQTRFSSL